MSQFDGIIRATYECHCRRCEQPALGLGRSHEEAVHTLKRAGWVRIGSRWFCQECASEGRRALEAEEK